MTTGDRYEALGADALDIIVGGARCGGYNPIKIEPCGPPVHPCDTASPGAGTWGAPSTASGPPLATDMPWATPSGDGASAPLPDSGTPDDGPAWPGFPVDCGPVSGDTDPGCTPGDPPNDCDWPISSSGPAAADAAGASAAPAEIPA